MENSLEKEVEDKLYKLYSKENMLRLKSKNPFYNKDKFSNDIKNFLEYCIEERKKWAQEGYKGEEFWEYASYLGNMIMKWGKRY